MLMFLLLSFFLSSIAQRKLIIVTQLFKGLFMRYRQDNLHQLATQMPTLIMQHNRFTENKNEAVGAHIPQHRDYNTKKLRHQDLGIKTPQHRETETNKPQHCDSKTFFQRTKSHNIHIPGLKNHDIKIPRPKGRKIKFLRNS